MAKVLMEIKIFPEDIETNLNQLKQEIQVALPSDAKLQKTEEEPIAFGLKALKVYVIVKDEEGTAEAVESAISKVKGVSQIQVEMATRL